MLPDPFLKADGTRVSSLAEWPAQRVNEIRTDIAARRITLDS